MALLLHQRPSDLMGMEGSSLRRFLFDRRVLSRYFSALAEEKEEQGTVKESALRTYRKLGIPIVEE